MSTPNNNSGRGWFEGTLDVISGMSAPRPSTPVRNRDSIPRSAPNSPGIARLPSQDSLDRSIHNDSGHGKSTAQIIRDLKQANARLTARTASLEADFMNQLQQTSRVYEEKQVSLVESNKQKEKHVATLESRCKIAETRIREKEEGLTKIKEESAFQRHTISDLKTQLHQLEQESKYASSSDSWNVEKQALVKEIQVLKRQGAEKVSKVPPSSPDRSVRTARSLPDPDGSPGSSWKQLDKTQKALDRSVKALTDFQSEQQRLSALHAERVLELKEELKASSATYEVREGILVSKIAVLEQNSNAGDLQSQLLERDETIAKLRQQVLEYSGQLTGLTEKIQKTKANADSQEQYRRDEADDLRVLNDAQEEEIDSLRKQVEEAVGEIEMREQELEEEREKATRSRGAEDGGQEVAILNESAQVATLQGRLDESHASLASLQQALEQSKRDTQVQVAALQKTLDKAIEEKNSGLREEKKSAEADDQQKHLVEEYKAQLEQLKNEKETAESDFQSQLVVKETELVTLRQSSGAGESSADDARVKELVVEVANLKDQLKELGAAKTTDQSGGSLEEDLRKELQATKESGVRRAAELQALVDEKEADLAELRQKLEDRDTTISALVKSSVSLEQQIDSSKSIINSLRTRLSVSNSEEGVDVVLDGPLDSELNTEVETLKESLAAAKAVESRLSQEVFRSKRQVHHAKKETTRLREQLDGQKEKNLSLSASLEEGLAVQTSMSMNDRSIGGDETTQRELEERDDAISNLVKQSMAKEREVAELQRKLSTMANELLSKQSGDAPATLSLEEVKQLRQEAEMFAGQVIEQDEEIDGLRNALQARDARVVELQKEMNDLKNKPAPVESAKIQDLEAEIDELKEGNSVQRDELRLLRRKAMDDEATADTIAEARREVAAARKAMEEFKTMADDLSAEKATLLEELEDVKAGTVSVEEVKELEALQQSNLDKVAALESQLKEREAAESTARTSDIDEMEMEGLKEERKTLERNLAGQSAAVDSARLTIRELERMLAEKTSAEAGAYEEEKEELLAEVEALTAEVEDLRHQLELMEEDKAVIEEFKQKLEQSEVDRQTSEKTIVDTFERKISLLNLDKDVTIDKLRKDLVQEKELSEEEMTTMAGRVKEYEMVIQGLKDQMISEVEQREAKIFALEHTLQAQEQLVGNMRSEMDHLQGSMETTALGRREEVEEMQKELVDLTSSVGSQDREITSLRMQLEEKKLEHQAEVSKLNETIASIEKESDDAPHRTAMDLQMDMRIGEVKERLEKLKYRNTSLQEDNTTLRERLEKAQATMNSTDEDRYADLQEQLKKKSAKVNELETELKIAVAASAAVPSPTKPPVPPSPTSARAGSAKRGTSGTPPQPPSPARSGSNKRNVTNASPGRRLGFLGRRRANSQDTDGSVDGTK